MKRIFSLAIILLAGWGMASAQTSGAVIKTIPATFTPTDMVKIIVDVSNVPNLAGKEPLYIWTWQPGDPPPGNGGWDNSNEAMRMVKEAPNVWSWTITPTLFYEKAPADITQLAFLVKAKNGNGDAKTNDIILPVSPLVYIPKAFRTFPSAVGQNEMVTFYLDQSLPLDIVTQRMTPTDARITLYAGANVVDAPKTVKLNKLDDVRYSASFFPPRLFAIPANRVVTRMVVVFIGKGRDANGNEVNVESPGFEYTFDLLK
jgi:hypothetical protein